MADLVDTTELRSLLESAGVRDIPSDFETLYDGLATSGHHDALVADIEERVRHYFEQIQIPDSATSYDYLLLSLRPKDLIATFNWDPLLAQAFRRHEGLIALPRLVFLHGNVAVGFCEEHRTCGWHDDRCCVCGKLFDPSPLLFPVRNKDYETRPAIRSQWAVLEQSLNEAYFVTIYGYRAPNTDAAARAAMLSVWARNQTREIAEVEIINVTPPEQLHQEWEDFIVRGHYITGDTILRAYTSWHPRRSCDALFAATMLNTPWKNDWLPEFVDPAALRNWVKPLWGEENVLAQKGGDISGRPCNEWHQQGS
jgi:hypothetical protein